MTWLKTYLEHHHLRIRIPMESEGPNEEHKKIFFFFLIVAVHEHEFQKKLILKYHMSFRTAFERNKVTVTKTKI